MSHYTVYSEQDVEKYYIVKYTVNRIQCKYYIVHYTMKRVECTVEYIDCSISPVSGFQWEHFRGKLGNTGSLTPDISTNRTFITI